MINIEGWLKLYRELIKKPIWKLSTPEQKAILITLLCMVNHEEKEWEWQNKKYICQPGQVITSLDKIVKEAGKGISIQNVRTSLLRFEKLGFLTNQSTKESRLITINNWELYQSQDVEPTKKPTNGSQRGNKGVTTNKNDKNDKNDKNIKDIYISIIQNYTSNPELINSLTQYVQMRQKEKSYTDHALKIGLSKLDKLASTDAEKIDIVNQSIERTWKGFFPVKDTPKQSIDFAAIYEQAKREASSNDPI